MIFNWLLNGVLQSAPETYSLVAQILQRNTIHLSEIGDSFNIPMPTMGGEVFWDTLYYRNGYRLQKHKTYTFHARILDSDDFRVACGHIDAMKDKFERITRNHFLKEGDIIGVARKKAGRLYEHYAVYVGDNQVIHYAAQGGNGDFNGIIHLAPFDEFLKDDDEYFVLYFDDINKMSLKNIFSKIFGGEVPKLYSPKETVRRAYSRLDEREYDLINNNCEHFAIWCKTGISESHQVKKILGGIMAVGAAVQYKKVYAMNQEAGDIPNEALDVIEDNNDLDNKIPQNLKVCEDIKNVQAQLAITQKIKIAPSYQQRTYANNIEKEESVSIKAFIQQGTICKGDKVLVCMMKGETTKEACIQRLFAKGEINYAGEGATVNIILEGVGYDEIAEGDIIVKLY